MKSRPVVVAAANIFSARRRGRLRLRDDASTLPKRPSPSRRGSFVCRSPSLHEDPTLSKIDVETVKAESRALRGSIAQELSEPTDRFGDESVQLLKFHGIYQQDDRDARRAAREGGGKAYSFMLRTKSPGGFLPRGSTARSTASPTRTATERSG